MSDYLVYDVFTDRPFAGNQLAVFPNAQTLPQDQLQTIAAEFNFSEVVFVYPPEHPDHAARLRIFTPTSEVDFAGHPIIGTTVALHDLGYGNDMTLAVGIGPVACRADKTGASFTTPAQFDHIASPAPDLVARALGLSVSSVKTDTHAPGQVSLGLPFVIVELTDRAALSACAPDMAAIREGAALHPAGLDFALFSYVRDDNHITSRMFAPLDNIPEDPATGSASATLAMWLTQITGEAQALHFVQGEDMGRPSHIRVKTTPSPATVTVTGQAVKVMEGRLTL